MSRVLVIASNTVRETIRQRVFLNVVVFGVGMIIFAMVVSNLTFGYPDRVVRSIGLSGISIAVNLLALLLGVGLIHREIDRKTLFVVLTRPVERWQYILGRYIGLMTALVVVFLGFVAIYFAILGYVLGTPRIQDVVALELSLIEASVLGAFAIVLSSFSTPTLSAGIGLGFWITCATVDDLINLTAKADAAVKALASGIAWLFPSFERFNYRGAAVYSETLDFSTITYTNVYGLLYIVCFTALASAILSRREMV